MPPTDAPHPTAENEPRDDGNMRERLREVERAVDELLTTRRWRIGDAIVRTLNRLRGRRDEPRAVRDLHHALARLSAAIESPAVSDPRLAARMGTTVAEWFEHYQREKNRRGIRWMGVPALKNALDAWAYQEMIFDGRPDVVVEIGSFAGGSTLFLCHLLDAIGHGAVVSIDRTREPFAISHPRLKLLTGDSGSPAIVAAVGEFAAGKRTMVIHDGDHSRDAVLRDLRLYADFVSVGSYFVVEDGILDVLDPQKFPAVGRAAPGPLPAIHAFLASDDRFEIDAAREWHLLTHNPDGFLRRVR